MPVLPPNEGDPVHIARTADGTPLAYPLTPTPPAEGDPLALSFNQDNQPVVTKVCPPEEGDPVLILWNVDLEPVAVVPCYDLDEIVCPYDDDGFAVFLGTAGACNLTLAGDYLSSGYVECDMAYGVRWELFVDSVPLPPNKMYNISITQTLDLPRVPAGSEEVCLWTRPNNAFDDPGQPGPPESYSLEEHGLTSADLSCWSSIYGDTGGCDQQLADLYIYWKPENSDWEGRRNPHIQWDAYEEYLVATGRAEYLRALLKLVTPGCSGEPKITFTPGSGVLLPLRESLLLTVSGVVKRGLLYDACKFNPVTGEYGDFPGADVAYNGFRCEVTKSGGWGVAEISVTPMHDWRAIDGPGFTLDPPEDVPQELVLTKGMTISPSATYPALNGVLDGPEMISLPLGYTFFLVTHSPLPTLSQEEQEAALDRIVPGGSAAMCNVEQMFPRVGGPGTGFVAVTFRGGAPVEPYISSNRFTSFSVATAMEYTGALSSGWRFTTEAAGEVGDITWTIEPFGAVADFDVTRENVSLVRVSSASTNFYTWWWESQPPMSGLDSIGEEVSGAVCPLIVGLYWRFNVYIPEGYTFDVHVTQGFSGWKGHPLAVVGAIGFDASNRLLFRNIGDDPITPGVISNLGLAPPPNSGDEGPEDEGPEEPPLLSPCGFPHNGSNSISYMSSVSQGDLEAAGYAPSYEEMEASCNQAVDGFVNQWCNTTWFRETPLVFKYGAPVTMAAFPDLHADNFIATCRESEGCSYSWYATTPHQVISESAFHDNIDQDLNGRRRCVSYVSCVPGGLCGAYSTYWDTAYAPSVRAVYRGGIFAMSLFHIQLTDEGYTRDGVDLMEINYNPSVNSSRNSLHTLTSASAGTMQPILANSRPGDWCRFAFWRDSIRGTIPADSARNQIGCHTNNGLILAMGWPQFEAKYWVTSNAPLETYGTIRESKNYFKFYIDENYRAVYSASLEEGTFTLLGPGTDDWNDVNTEYEFDDENEELPVTVINTRQDCALFWRWLPYTGPDQPDGGAGEERNCYMHLLGGAVGVPWGSGARWSYRLAAAGLFNVWDYEWDYAGGADFEIFGAYGFYFEDGPANPDDPYVTHIPSTRASVASLPEPDSGDNSSYYELRVATPGVVGEVVFEIEPFGALADIDPVGVTTFTLLPSHAIPGWGAGYYQAVFRDTIFPVKLFVNIWGDPETEDFSDMSPGAFRVFRDAAPIPDDFAYPNMSVAGGTSSAIYSPNGYQIGGGHPQYTPYGLGRAFLNPFTSGRTAFVGSPFVPSPLQICEAETLELCPPYVKLELVDFPGIEKVFKLKKAEEVSAPEHPEPEEEDDPPNIFEEWAESKMYELELEATEDVNPLASLIPEADQEINIYAGSGLVPVSFFYPGDTVVAGYGFDAGGVADDSVKDMVCDTNNVMEAPVNWFFWIVEINATLLLKSKVVDGDPDIVVDPEDPGESEIIDLVAYNIEGYRVSGQNTEEAPGGTGGPLDRRSNPCLVNNTSSPGPAPGVAFSAKDITYTEAVHRFVRNYMFEAVDPGTGGWEVGAGTYYGYVPATGGNYTRVPVIDEEGNPTWTYVGEVSSETKERDSFGVIIELDDREEEEE